MSLDYPKFVKQHENKMTKTKLKKAQNYFMNKVVEYLNSHYKNDYGVNFDNDCGKLIYSINEYTMKDNLGFTKKRIEKINKRLKNLMINITYYVSLKGRIRKNLDNLDCFIIPEMYNDDFVKEKIDKNTNKIYGWSIKIENKDSSVSINKKMKKFILLIEDILKVIILTSTDKSYYKKLIKTIEKFENLEEGYNENDCK